MSLFEGVPGSNYQSIVFEAVELEVIRSACTEAAAKELSLLEATAGEGLEQFAGQVRRANESDMTGKMVSLFKADQEILIEQEDLAPVRDCLESYRPRAPEEHAGALESALDKIGRCCNSLHGHGDQV